MRKFKRNMKKKIEGLEIYKANGAWFHIQLPESHLEYISDIEAFEGVPASEILSGLMLNGIKILHEELQKTKAQAN